ncbi:MAG TPA: ribosome biogenesis GTP-binding protein YihA/YsxC [Perlabentimonas sp.]|jgi:GTP-binding protein|nr:ribosome biogenesis GTP-binding protein YihA/YsxC [Bacteroidales bacterium]MDD4673350.1 ribosome biogenesis GTP-binding protein YihA/YsxC [Bacteroidales bacterium]MDY0349455.1 ribosome biogenesis GTP-binding protein YihA/YsxC [Tenuifilaceae bacterium]HZJ73891.1 ribosome biogenesis GTP-binding protein YihA/YsxC [Perlabentimonas sp.]
MIIRSANFVKSSAELKQCPEHNLPEYAFIGRSNVGKSSLINMLTGINTLAKVSSTPGKTQLINHFEINKSWYLVDLPGYGYAKTGKKQRAVFAQMNTKYITNRETLTCLFVLIDSRHEPQQIDTTFIGWLGANGIPFALIFTKSDKLKPAVLKTNIEAYKNHLYETWEELPPIFISSSTNRSGREEILDYIAQVNTSLESGE